MHTLKLLRASFEQSITNVFLLFNGNLYLSFLHFKYENKTHE